MSRPTREARVAPNIYEVLDVPDGSRRGWRVYVKRGGVLKPKRFPPPTTIEQLQTFIDSFKEETAILRQQQRAAALERKGSLAGDVERYLGLKVVKAMPSYDDRTRELGKWVKALGRKPRSEISARMIDEELQAFFDSGLSGSTVNKLRTALMSVWTRLDGRGAANPVRETKVFPEADEEARGRSYDLLREIVDAIPDRSRPVKGVKGSTKRGSQSKARIAIMVWTGMAPVQVGRLKNGQHFSIAEGWYVTPRRQKGKQPRFPRPVVRKQMTAEAKAAFESFVKVKAEGPFDRRALRHTWLRAVAKVEAAIQRRTKDPTFALDRVRLYDIKHSFATQLYKATKNLGTVAQMIDVSERTVRRYAAGAVPEVLKDAARAFARAIARKARGRPRRRRSPL